MTTNNIQDKRDGLELALLFQANELGGKAIINQFQNMLTEYLQGLLSPELSDAQALEMRFKAMGLVEALTQMGVTMSHAKEAPMRRAARDRIAQSLGTDLAP